MSKRKAPLNVHEAKTHFSKLLARVAKGERVPIAKNGVLVAELVPASATAPPTRHFGECTGKVTIARDFNAPLPANVLADFYK